MSHDKAFRRQETHQDCRAAEAQWAQCPGRNLILFFDGTGNIMGDDAQTNVVKLLHLIDQGPPPNGGVTQLVYYDPGVGSSNQFPPAGLVPKMGSLWSKIKGLALGEGAFENVAQGYEFLCREYREGDRIWLFGFSRGAFTARAVAGMVNMYGLIQPSTLPVLPSLVNSYFAHRSKTRSQHAQHVIEHLALNRRPLLHFIGVWDTVATIGLFDIGITNKPTVEHKRFVHVRHALAIHEIRSKYVHRPYIPPQFTAHEQPLRSFEQRWFHGAHCDVGGGYLQSHLSDIALNWMAQEAFDKGLRFKGAAPQPVASPAPASPHRHDETQAQPLWLLTGLSPRKRPSVPPPNDPPHSLLHPSATADAPPARRSPTARPQGLLTLVCVLLCMGLGALIALHTPHDMPWANVPRHAFGFVLWGFLVHAVNALMRRLSESRIRHNRPMPSLLHHVHWPLWSLLLAIWLPWQWAASLLLVPVVLVLRKAVAGPA